MSSATAFTNLNITANLHNVAKWMRKLTLLELKPRRVNHVLTHSSTSTAEASIKLIQTHAPSGSITSTTIGITKNNKNFAIVEATQFAQP